MKKKTSSKNTPTKTVLRIVIVTALLLLIPFIGMQFTDELTWEVSDFVVAGGLVAGAALFYELIKRNARSTEYTVAATVALIAVVILVWVELAVGIFN